MKTEVRNSGAFNGGLGLKIKMEQQIKVDNIAVLDDTYATVRDCRVYIESAPAMRAGRNGFYVLSKETDIADNKS